VSVTVFFVEGECTPQGSHKAFIVGGHARITDDNPRTRQWRSRVVDAYRSVCRDVPHGGPVAVDVVFMRRRNPNDLLKDGSLRKGARERPIVRRADLDKLQRALGDALSRIAWDDDSQIVEWRSCSMFSRGLEGAVVRISRRAAPDDWVLELAIEGAEHCISLTDGSHDLWPAPRQVLETIPGIRDYQDSGAVPRP
jgi:crossover junction endodeoxyribonuclease RusA